MLCTCNRYGDATQLYCSYVTKIVNATCEVLARQMKFSILKILLAIDGGLKLPMRQRLLNRYPESHQSIHTLYCQLTYHKNHVAI